MMFNHRPISMTLCERNFPNHDINGLFRLVYFMYARLKPFLVSFYCYCLLPTVFQQMAQTIHLRIWLTVANGRIWMY